MTLVGERPITPPTSLRDKTFASLHVPNYRRFLFGQSVSMAGTWMQTIAMSWLALQLTGSATTVGAVIAVQMVPVLLLAPYAGVIADRMDKRRLLMGLLTVMAGQAAVLGALVATGQIQLWHLYVLAAVLGTANSFETPTRQSFVLEMVGSENVRNAVSLNSVLVNVSRAVGPAVAGIVIATGGMAVCFLANAVSFAAVIFSLYRIDPAALHRSTPTPRAPGQLREGFAYVLRTPVLAVSLAAMALVGCLAFEFQVVLPVVASETFAGDSRTYGFLTGAMGVGAIIGGLGMAAWGRTGMRALALSSAGFGLAMLATAVSPNLALALVGMGLVGATSVMFQSTCNSTLQLAADPHMRGRVMALWTVAFLGSTPIGGPIAGFVSQHLGGRAGLAMGALACFLATAMLAAAAGRARNAVAAT